LFVSDVCAVRPSARPGGARPHAGGLPEHEVDRAQQTQPGPEKVESQRLLHVEDGERDEHDQRDRFLQDFQLSELQRTKTDPVGGDLQQIFEEGDTPA
jgi:hypothetical protein